MIRAANAGPIPGRRSKVAESARSTSIGPTGGGEVRGDDAARDSVLARSPVGAAADRETDGPARRASAESTAASCDASALASLSVDSAAPPSQARTAVPNAVTSAK